MKSAGTPAATSSARPRRRRASSHVKELVRDSALALFAERGYSGTSTRAVAEAAGVTEQMLFRHFSSKRELFKQVIWTPFEEILRQYSDVARKHGAVGDVRARAHGYVETLYSHLRRDRRFFRAFLISVTTDPELRQLIGQARSPLMEFFNVLARFTRKSTSELREDLDSDIAVRITFSFILAMTVFDEIYFPKGMRPTSRHLLHEMKLYMTDGIGRELKPGRKPSGAVSRPRAPAAEPARRSRRKPA